MYIEKFGNFDKKRHLLLIMKECVHHLAPFVIIMIINKKSFEFRKKNGLNQKTWWFLVKRGKIKTWVTVLFSNSLIRTM